MNQKPPIEPHDDATPGVDLVCRHCGEAPGPFCCQGCQGAYQLIHDLHMEGFYALRKQQSLSQKSSKRLHLATLLDDESYQKSFCRQLEGSRKKATFAIAGLHCYACVWLIEKSAARRFDDVLLTLSLSDERMQVDFDPRVTALSEVIVFVEDLGFEVRPLTDGADTDYRDLIRLGINTFCTLNIMMLALPDYLDHDMARDAVFWQMFRVLQGLLCAVVFFYGMRPMLRAAMASARGRGFTIDLSIVLALSVTFGHSLVNTLRGTGVIYFDSIATVVTLIGLSRYLQKHLLSRAYRRIRGAEDVELKYVRRLQEAHEPNLEPGSVLGATTLVPLAQIHTGDLFLALPGDGIHLESEIIRGESEVHYEQITGESDRHLARPMERVRAGASNLSAPLVLRSLEEGSASFLIALQGSIDEMLAKRGRYTRLSDQLAKGFFACVLLAAAAILAFVSHTHSFEEGMSRMVAALLIACPCAFAASVPLAMVLATAAGLRQGIVIKSQEALEALAHLRTVLFDKTGTLTQGEPEIVGAMVDTQALEGLGLDEITLYCVLQRLKSYSQHHVIASLAKWVDDKNLQLKPPAVPIEFVREQFGAGLIFCIGSDTWRIGHWDFACGEAPSSELARDFGELAPTLFVSVFASGASPGRLVAAFALSDVLRPDSLDTVRGLQQLGISSEILSGDREERVLAMGALLGLQTEQVHGGQTLEDKKRFVEHLSPASLLGSSGTVAMVGNGFNDALALVSADVGIAVSDANPKARDLSEVCLVKPGCLAILPAVRIARHTVQKIKAAFAFAVMFNVLGLGLAALGFLTPGWAAVLMPVSSLTVMGIATRRTPIE